MLCSILMRCGIEQIGVIERQMEEWMEKHGYDSVAELKGSMSQKKLELFRPGNIRARSIHSRPHYFSPNHNWTLVCSGRSAVLWWRTSARLSKLSVPCSGKLLQWPIPSRYMASCSKCWGRRMGES
jgi:hypothetical protein